jgi:hypothetical protein
MGTFRWFRLTLLNCLRLGLNFRLSALGTRAATWIRTVPSTLLLVILSELILKAFPSLYYSFDPLILLLLFICFRLARLEGKFLLFQTFCLLINSRFVVEADKRFVLRINDLIVLGVNGRFALICRWNPYLVDWVIKLGPFGGCMTVKLILFVHVVD